MIMNNTFDWNRFCEVVKKDFRNLWPLAGRTMLILALLPMTVWIFTVIFPTVLPIPSGLRLWFVKIVAAIAACATASRLYRTWNLKGEGIYFAMLPASKLEKLLSAFFFSVFVCPLLVFVGSYLVDIILTAMPFGGYHRWIWERDMNLFSYAIDTNPGIHYGPWGFLYNLTYILSFVGSTLLFMFTSTVFKRHKVLLTFLCWYAFEFALSLLLLPLLRTNSFGAWIMQMKAEYGAEGVLTLFYGGMILFALVEIVLFGWLTWRRLDRMGY